MVYNDLDFEWFAEYVADLAELYPHPAITSRKVEIYFDFLAKKGFCKSQYENSKMNMIQSKTDGFFPTIAEILENIKVDKDGKPY